MVFSIIWYELVMASYLYYYENTRSFQSSCYQAVLQSYICLKMTFSNPIWLRMKKSDDKSTFLQILGVLGTS